MTSVATTVNPLFPGPTWTSHRLLEDEVMDDQLKHHLSMMLFGMSDLGECLEVARRIGTDEHSWIDAWADMAERVQERAETADKRGKVVSAASAYLRASTYWRASLMHFGFGDDPRHELHARASYAAYDRYLAVSGYPGEYLEIPYEDSFLPAYLYRSPTAPPAAPLLILGQGRDAWPEDTRWVYDGAMRRGMHCLGLHGPGQGLALRLNGLPFRPDWENVIRPVVDVVLGLDGVDPERIGLMGLSFGGYLAPRAAAFEDRLKLCIADPGVLDWGSAIKGHFPPSVIAAFDTGPEAFDAAVASLLEETPRFRFGVRDFMWKHGVSTPYALFEQLTLCDLTPYVEQIRCETLVMEGIEEIRSPGESQALYDALRCPKHLMVFDERSTAQLHCQGGASATAAETMFDWLDERL